MTKQLENILWMSEELDFNVEPGRRNEAEDLIHEFLSRTGNTALHHEVICPNDNLPKLDEELYATHQDSPFTIAIDLTRGEMSQRLPILESGIPLWDSFSMGRVRQATGPTLPTTGYVLSHNSDEIRSRLAKEDLDHILILDDTSFSGSTSLMAEELISTAFPDVDMQFSHGFLIQNSGSLGPNPGSKTCLEENGDKTMSGMEMQTPRDDGWHIFDIVKQGNLTGHLQAVGKWVELVGRPDYESASKEMLQDNSILKALFPDTLPAAVLEAERAAGRFVLKGSIEGDFHVRNPQLLPNIVREGHLLPPQEWHGGQETVFDLLNRLNRTLKV